MSRTALAPLTFTVETTRPAPRGPRVQPLGTIPHDPTPALTAAVKQRLREIRKLGCRAPGRLHMRMQQVGTVAAITAVVANQSTGFEDVVRTLGRADLAMESVVLHPDFAKHFAIETQRACYARFFLRRD